jgi:hypothetical protein
MTTKSLTVCIEGVDHRLYQECFLSSPDLYDNPHTTATKCHRTLKFRRDNIICHGEKKYYHNEKTKQIEAFCQTLVQNLLGLQGSLIPGAAHKEDRTHKPIKLS